MARSNKPLPGISFHLNDGNLVPVIPDPTTDRVMVIGNAIDGPINRPIMIRSMSDAEDLFGPMTYTGDYLNPQNSLADGTYADNNMMKAINEVLIGGGGNIICVRVGGNFAYSLSAFSASVNVYGLYPGRIYNGVQLSLTAPTATGRTLTIVQPSSKGGTISMSFDTATTMARFVNAVNSDARNNTVRLTGPVSTAQSAITIMATGSLTLAGGTNGTGAPGEDYYSSKASYYTLLTQTYGTFDSLIDTETDIVLLTGIYADDQVTDDATATTTSVAQDFAEFVHTLSSETLPCHGVIGLRPTGLTSPAELTTFAFNNYLDTSYGYYNQAARWIKFGPFMLNGFYYSDPLTGERMDIGGKLSVVAGPDLVLTERSISWYIENGAAVYAGLASTLPAQSATTNKRIGSVKAINGTFTRDVHERLNQGVGYNRVTRVEGGGAYVSFKYDQIAGGPVVVADNTASSRVSDYRTLQIVRITNFATRLVKAVLRPFIGEANNVEAKTAMRTQLNTALGKMVEAGALLGGDGNGYRFAIMADPVDLVLGTLNVVLFLRPALQIREIKVTVSLTQ